MICVAPKERQMETRFHVMGIKITATRDSKYRVSLRTGSNGFSLVAIEIF